MKRNKLNRRTFIKKTSATTIAASLPTIVPASVFGKNAPSNRIQVGQIGCGRIARDHDMPGTMQYETAQLVAVCDVDQNRLKDGKKLVDQYYQNKGKKADTKMFDNYQTFSCLLFSLCFGSTDPQVFFRPSIDFDLHRRRQRVAQFRIASYPACHGLVLFYHTQFDPLVCDYSVHFFQKQKLELWLVGWLRL